MIQRIKEFSGKNVLVSGGTSGIGRAIAIAFGATGARVGVVGRRSEAAAAVAKEVTAAGGFGVALAADVGDKPALEATVTPFLESGEDLTAIVSAAGLDLPQMIAEADAEDTKRVFQTNILGTLFMMQIAIPIMRRQGHGTIVNVTSIAAKKVFIGNAVYGASKAAVSMLTKTAAAEEGPHGIRVNELAPGPVDTPMLRGFFAEPKAQGTGWDSEKLRSGMPLRRIGIPEDIAGAVLWLCSNEARFVTGACLSMDGGLLVS